MTRAVTLILAVAAGCLISFITPAAEADASIPNYFFKGWSVTRDCSEVRTGPGNNVRPGQTFRMTRDSADGLSFALQVLDPQGRLIGGNWANIKLQYRAGRPMSSVPADYACIPGNEAASPFLALGNYSVSAEPWYEFERWYGLVKIHGQPHHIVIFPRPALGPDGAVILLQDADSNDNVNLDNNGVIHTQNK